MPRITPRLLLSSFGLKSFGPQDGPAVTPVEATAVPSAGRSIGEQSLATDGPEPFDDGGPADAGFGIHGILRKTDYWFSAELNSLEKFARLQAEEHAKANLPRLNMPAEDELEIEQVLRVRAGQVFLEWCSRVRRRVQDAIQLSCAQAGSGLVQLRHSYDQLLLTTQNIQEAEGSLQQALVRSEGAQKTVQYGGLLKGKFYWVLFALLAVVDWVANVPVFNQLLPRDPSTQELIQKASDSAPRYMVTGGLRTLGERIAAAPDIAILALGIVVFLMFLCHACGKFTRRVVAFNPKDEPMVQLGMRSHRRQAMVPLFLTALGLILAVTFLCYSRSQLSAVTQQRVTDARNQVAQTQSELKAADEGGEVDKVQAANLKLALLQQKLIDAERDADYASGIKAMNLAIMCLNIVLVITATTASYMHDSGSLTEVAYGDPKTLALEARLGLLRSEAAAQRSRLNALDEQVQGNIAQARYLASCVPLKEAPSKARRLEAVVPLFRAENARVRGMDVQSIAAFQVERPLDLAAVTDEAFTVPPELREYEADFARVRGQVERIQALTTEAKVMA